MSRRVGAALLLGALAACGAPPRPAGVPKASRTGSGAPLVSGIASGRLVIHGASLLLMDYLVIDLEATCFF